MFSLGYGYYATFILGLREEKTTISVRLLRLDSHALTLSPLGLQCSGLIGKNSEYGALNTMLVPIPASYSM